jgi:hypothetical protein
MDIREQLKEAKARIETKAGIKFSKESLALADLVSEFVAIKVGAQAPNVEAILTKAAEGQAKQSTVGQQIAKPADNLYFD